VRVEFNNSILIDGKNLQLPNIFENASVFLFILFSLQFCSCSFILSLVILSVTAESETTFLYLRP